MKTTRREAIISLAAGSVVLPASASAYLHAGTRSQWRAGIEGQRKADLGNGTFLNPIISGDHADPTDLTLSCRHPSMVQASLSAVGDHSDLSR
jgi:xylan 1,4-beta-xylosidase